MGLTRRIWLDATLPNLPFLVAGIVLFSSVWLNIKKYQQPEFQVLLLSAALIMPVIFSTGSEDVTYIIAVIGAGIWLSTEKKNGWHGLLFFLLLFVSVLPLWTILPLKIRDQYPYLYAIKALPYTLIWLTIIYRLHTGKIDRTVV